LATLYLSASANSPSADSIRQGRSLDRGIGERSGEPSAQSPA
jgi:hypothetical protein